MTDEPERPRDGEYDDWLDAIERGEGYHFICPERHGSLPPRRTCPRCGATELERAPLPERGELVTYTETHVAGPEFNPETPYVTGIADLDGVRLTGVVRGIEPAIGVPVTVEVGENPTTGERLLVLRG
jgi:uncharacterized OB-fold protein